MDNGARISVMRRATLFYNCAHRGDLVPFFVNNDTACLAGAAFNGGANVSPARLWPAATRLTRLPFLSTKWSFALETAMRLDFVALSTIAGPINRHEYGVI